ncbi:transposase DNA-binding-containing protein, partial [Chloroflexus sp.]|uniref:IS4/Tn5 family transposase DNA-binding protein n=1 Tax=Chloroflexus sp. TaxID=1904827 RepID=UPI003A102584
MGNGEMGSREWRTPDDFRSPCPPPNLPPLAMHCPHLGFTCRFWSSYAGSSARRQGDATMQSWAEHELRYARLGDARLNRRLMRLVAALAAQP